MLCKTRSQSKLQLIQFLVLLEAVNDSVLAGKLKALSAPDLELLTLIAIDGFSQADVARKMDCARNTISKKIARIKRFLK